MKIDQPGVYDLSAEDYHADPVCEPSLSASIAKLLVTATPLHARAGHPRLNPDHEPEESEKFDIGSAAHALILRDKRAFEIVDAKDWKTKSAGEKRDEARAAGKIPLLTSQWIRVECMARAARYQLDAHREASGAFKNGKPEQTLVWREGDIWCRARLDYRVVGAKVFDDYKSTAALADPDAWSRILFNLGFDMQAAFYRRGIRALGLCDDPQFRFIVQETKKPHALSVIGLMPGALDLADHKVCRAIAIWDDCLRTGHWPGYPSRTCYVDVPPWAEAQFMARDSRAHDTAREVADEFHRPLEDA